MKTALYFGSFNPCHIGHLKIIEALLNKGYKVEVIISPHNPHKDPKNLIDFQKRLEILSYSIHDYIKNPKNLHINTIEQYLPKPNYTYLTLRELEKQHQDMVLVVGTDVLFDLINWKNYEEVIKYPIINIEREYDSRDTNFDILSKVMIIDKIHINDTVSSTAIRYMMINDMDGLEESGLVTPNAFEIIKQL